MALVRERTGSAVNSSPAHLGRFEVMSGGSLKSLPVCRIALEPLGTHGLRAASHSGVFEVMAHVRERTGSPLYLLPLYEIPLGPL